MALYALIASNIARKQMNLDTQWESAYQDTMWPRLRAPQVLCVLLLLKVLS